MIDTVQYQYPPVIMIEIMIVYAFTCVYSIHMSCGRNYVHGQLAMSKLGGPLSVVKVLNFLSFHYLK